jgi:uncharacterized metal-binding protein/predicted Fe-Mo cluster-binding NifX family protein
MGKERKDMQIGIPLFSERVAPRCTIADSILLVRINRNEIVSKKYISIEDSSWIGLLKTLIDMRIDTLVCGGINREDKKLVVLKGISVIDNVACSEAEVLEALVSRKLTSGYGFTTQHESIDFFEDDSEKKDIPSDFNCLRCPTRECEINGICPYLRDFDFPKGNEKQMEMLDSALDISLEDERKLCRLSELIYYALEMKYKRLGIAYCVDMSEPTEILVSVLRRFFEVNPVCCKISGNKLFDETRTGKHKIACNPIGQAEVLNKLGTDLNIIVGLCVGADCVFSELSQAPVTTLFVKDKSLANNPIGAIYSEYYLKEVKDSVL